MALPRSLQFKDRFVERLVQEIPYACSTEPILFPDNETPIKFMIELSQNEFTALLSAVLTGADLSYPERSHEVVWSLLKMVECPVDICEVLTDCLQPLFDEINTKLDSIQTGLDTANQVIEEIREVQEGGQTTQPPTLPPVATSASYAGALALIREMHKNNLKYYAEAEASFVDNASEALSIVLELFKEFQGLPYDEAFELGNAYFENQVTTYKADYPDMEIPAACSLMCYIDANDGVLDIDVWGDWLFALTETVPENAAAAVFTRYSPARQTFLNQIAEFFNQEESLQSYFQDLWQVYYAGTQTPAVVPPECDCPNDCNVYDFRDEDFSPPWHIRDNVTDEPLSIYSAGVGYIPREQSVGGFQNQIYRIGALECSTLEYVYTAANAPTQVQLFWCSAEGTPVSVAAGLTVGTGTVTDSIDLSALTPPSGATGFLLVSGSDTDIDDVVTWQQANFS